MRAIGLYQSLPLTDPEALLDLEVPAPELRPHDLLVRVKAVSVNPVDTKVRRFRLPQKSETPKILGYDGAGIVEGVGEAVSLFKVGDKVYFAGDITRDGSNAELIAIDERICALKPKTIDFAKAAALPLTTLTAWEGMHDRMGIPTDPEKNAGRHILIIGGAGGVGSIAIQLAKRAGLIVIATASRPESSEWCKDLGADHVADHRNLVETVRGLGIDMVEYILCASSTDDYFAACADLIAPQGKVCFIVANTQPVNASIFQAKSVAICWEYMFTRPQFTTLDIARQHDILKETAHLVDLGLIRTTATKELTPINASTLREAHGLIEAGRTIGKVVISGEFVDG